MATRQTFGSAAPLPGQQGHNVRGSDALAAETSAMEMRLETLRSQMAGERQRRDEDNAKPRVGGARWRSARGDRKTVKKYGQEVRARDEQRSAAAAAAAAQPRQAQRRPAPPPAAASTFADKPVAGWDPEDVQAWLGRLNLAQYAAVFGKNEISGPILLEVGLDDLDYMSVTVLAHRKVLLKGIEALKRTGAFDAAAAMPSPQRAPLPHHGEAKAAQRESARGAKRGPASPAAARPSAPESKPDTSPLRSSPPKQHWSSLKPLAETKPARPAPPPGPNDGSGGGGPWDGAYDEAAAAADFKAAVAEWRTGGAAPQQQQQQPPSPARGAAADTEWRRERAASVAAAAATAAQGQDAAAIDDAAWAAWAGTSDEATEWRNPFGGGAGGGGAGNGGASPLRAPPVEAPPSLTPRRGEGPPRGGGGGGAAAAGTESLMEGTYDEDAERRAFQAAVAEWRGGDAKGGGGGADAAASPKRAAAADAPAQAKAAQSLMDGTYDEAKASESFKSAVDSWRNPEKEPAAAKLARELAEKMDADHKDFLQRSQHQREQTELQRKRDNELAGLRARQAAAAAAVEREDKEAAPPPRRAAPRAAAVAAAAPAAKVPALKMHQRGPVAVELLSSVLTPRNQYVPSPEEKQAEGFYGVEEPDSD